jgi:8-oxo-dGTP pyrophosphatase MutT (NUDIX family)
MRNTIQGEKQFTASVWILTKTNPKKVLLIHHKKLNKWQQPGGHVEIDENPVECAIREVKEETGVDIGILNDQVQVLDGGDKFLPAPTFLQEQNIPQFGEEPAHYHLDINYVVEIDEQKLKHSDKEAHGIGWFTKKEALKLSIHENTKIILHKILL